MGKQVVRKAGTTGRGFSWGHVHGRDRPEIREVATFWRRGDVPCRYVLELLREREQTYTAKIRELEQARARVRALLERALQLEPKECGPEKGCHLISAGVMGE